MSRAETGTGSTNKSSSSGSTSTFVIALLVAGTFFMENLDSTIITPAVPAMAKGFNVPSVDLNTGVSAYMLTLGILIPVSGWIADRFGPRKVFSFAIALFTLASVLCGLSTNLWFFVAARVLQGVGGAMMVPVGRLVVLRVTPKAKLVSAIAALTWPALIAPVLGPPVGGLISDHFSWQWIFYINLPLGVIALLLALKLVPAENNHDTPAFDWYGFASTAIALFGLLAAAEILQRPDPAFLWAAVAGVIGLVLLILGGRHLKRTSHPMIDLSCLSIKSYAVTIWGGSLFRMGINAVPFLVPIMFQTGFGFSAFKSGLMLMAVFAGNLAIKPLTTPIMRHLGFRIILVGNGLINTAALAACALFTKGMPLPLILGILFIGGMTRSMQFTALNTIAFADVPDDKINSANTLFSAATQLSMGLGIALGAIAWRIGTAFAPDNTHSLVPFHIAFLIVAVTSVLSMIDLMGLPKGVAEHVVKGKKKQSSNTKSEAS